MSLFRDILVYGVSAALARSAALLAMPILARQLGVQEYGAVAIAGVMSVLLAVVADLQISAGMGRHYHEESGPDARSSFVSTGFYTIALASLSISALALAGSPWITALLFGEMRFQPAVAIVAFQVPFQTLQAYLLYALRLSGRQAAYVGSSTAAATVGAGLAVVLVTQTSLGWQGALLGIAAGQGLGFLIALTCARDFLHLRFRQSALRTMLRYGLPSLPAAAGGTLQQAFGQLFLARFLSLHEVGTYAVGARISQILTLFQASFGLGWYPFLFRSLAAGKRHEASHTGLELYFMLGVPLLAAVTAFAPELVRLLAGPAYAPAVWVLPALCLAELLQGLLPIASAGIMASKKTHLTSVAYGAGLAVTVAATVIVAPFLGLMGPAVGLALGRTTNLVCTELLSRRIRHGSPVWRPLVWGIVAAHVVIALCALSWQIAWPLRVPVAALIAGLTVVVWARISALARPPRPQASPA